MATYKPDTEKLLTQLRQQVPTRGIERHLAILRNVSDLSTDLQSPFVAKLGSDQSLQTIIAFPPQIQRGWHYVPKQALLFTPTDFFHLLASIWPDQEPQITHIKGCGLMYMKASLLLLYGYLEIVSEGETTPARLGMEFNTVGWNQLSRPLRQLLQTTIAAPRRATSRTCSPAARPALDKLPLKFSNGVVLYGLLPGEEMQDLVFQPGTWRLKWRFFKQPITANTLLLLTSNFVVLIQEELKVAQGWIVTYIPRDGIVGIRNQPRGLWNELAIQLKRGGQTAEFKVLLESQAAQVWRAQWIEHGGQWQDLAGEREN